MTTQVTIPGEWRETNRGERFFGFDHLMRRYEKIGVDVAAKLDRIVQAAGDRRSAEKNAVDSSERESPNNFSGGSVDRERLRSAQLCCTDSENWFGQSIRGVHDR